MPGRALYAGALRLFCLVQVELARTRRSPVRGHGRLIRGVRGRRDRRGARPNAAARRTSPHLTVRGDRGRRPRALQRRSPRVGRGSVMERREGPAEVSCVRRIRRDRVREDRLR
jgi:hypothetical protein